MFNRRVQAEETVSVCVPEFGVYTLMTVSAVAAGTQMPVAVCNARLWIKRSEVCATLLSKQVNSSAVLNVESLLLQN